MLKHSLHILILAPYSLDNPPTDRVINSKVKHIPAIWPQLLEFKLITLQNLDKTDITGRMKSFLVAIWLSMINFLCLSLSSTRNNGPLYFRYVHIAVVLS